MCTSFCAPSPSRTTCKARSCSTASSAARKPRSIGPPAAGMRACRAWPVANSSTVSLVEVSLSTVVQLKLPATPRASIACKAAAGIAASVNTKQSMVAMSGAIMPLPLAMPQMRTSVSADPRGAGRGLGEGVGGHDAARRRLPSVGGRARRAARAGRR